MGILRYNPISRCPENGRKVGKDNNKYVSAVACQMSRPKWYGVRVCEIYRVQRPDIERVLSEADEAEDEIEERADEAHGRQASHGVEKE